MITSIRLIDVAMPRRAGARDLEARHKQSGLPLSWAAIVYAGLGDIDRAFACLEQDYRDRVPVTSYLPINWEFEPLRRDKRHDDLVSRLGLR